MTDDGSDFQARMLAREGVVQVRSPRTRSSRTT